MLYHGTIEGLLVITSSIEIKITPTTDYNIVFKLFVQEFKDALIA